jgi:Holliday junction resolvasome RuvABC ATP-dependent DNA helicase subunit
MIYDKKEVKDFYEFLGEGQIIPMEIIKENTGEEPTKVEIVNGKFDSSKIIEYKGEEIKKFEFRPQVWEQFIGQKEGKNRAKTIVKKANRKIRCHFLVDGIKGHGKTTFVELFAKDLGAKLIQRVGKQVDEDELLNIINEINTSKEKYVIFFIDEMETMDWKVIKVLNPIIEQFKIAGKKIKPFIFAGATINKHILITNNPDTLDRIPPSHHIKFARYNAKEIGTIVKQYYQQLYPNEKIPQEVIDIISKNCKFNPRTSISLLEDYIVEQDIKQVLNNSKIIKDGLNEIDIDILKVLNNTTRAMGANALAMRVKLSQKEYITEFEPFLVEYGYINRVPSRVITEKGKELLGRLK